MTGVQLVGNGGLDQLILRHDIPVPHPQADEVLIRVGASSVNNTDINTRTGWYSHDADAAHTSWSGQPISFPRIQGADCCGRIVAAGSAVDPSRLGERVLVRTMQDPLTINSKEIPVTLGSEIDGAFAEYLVVRSSEAFRIESPLTDSELATFPCAYSTAEGLLQRAGVSTERVLITGASGGVGSALVQLAAMRGADVTAVASPDNHQALRDLGAHRLVARDASLLEELGDSTIDVVGGDSFAELLKILTPRGRYATAGAVAGPDVALDLRDLYLKDLTLFGCTFHPRSVFADLVGYIEAGGIAPIVADEYDLADIQDAQERFLSKDFFGKIAIVSP
ncbi:MAG: alcohol dehydrogenase family protein [Actinomycetia bacterium]|nr:alcohol dehydrogenase family protein [Actinomycetes bacterium]